MSNDYMKQLSEAVSANADLILVTGGPAMLRAQGAVQVLSEGEGLGHGEVAAALKAFVSDREWGLFTKGEVILSAVVAEGVGRFRLFAVRCGDVDTVVFRPITERFLDWKESGSPAVVEELSRVLTRRLVLVSGMGDTGRTTTVARLVRSMKREGSVQVVMVESCPEYVIDVDGLVVTRFEKSGSSEKKTAAIRAMNPEVVVIDEIESYEDLMMAISAAEGGAHVIAVTRGISTIETLLRLFDLVPERFVASVRNQFSFVFEACITQRALGRNDGQGRVVASEICVFNPAIAALIRNDKMQQLTAMIQIGAQQRMRTLAHSISDLVKDDVVSLDEALRAERYPDEIQLLLDRDAQKSKEAAKGDSGKTIEEDGDLELTIEEDSSAD